jgi:tRNA (mo5U34)-methyltransferase
MSTSSSSREILKAISDSVDFWWHSIDLGQGVVTPGRKTAPVLASELESLHMPDLTGKSVLDIGTFDGYFAFAAEHKGAGRIVAFDHYVWSLDLPAHIEYIAECKRKGVTPLPNEQTPEWQPEKLPGRRAYDAAHKALNSRVETVVGDYMLSDPEPHAAFDVVLYLGVLYHMPDPLASLKRVAHLTKKGGMAIVETHAALIPGYEHLELSEFYSAGQMDGDTTNYWGPNMQALVGLCLAAGFTRVEVKADYAAFWKRRGGVKGARQKFELTRREQGTAAAIKLIASHVIRRLPLASLFTAKRPLHYRAVVHAYK